MLFPSVPLGTQHWAGTDKCSVHIQKDKEDNILHMVTHKIQENFGGGTRVGVANYALKTNELFVIHSTSIY